MADVIQMKNVSKNYGKIRALNDVSLTIPKGRIIGLFGKNGAGKTTLLRCSLGFLKFKGDIDVMDMPITRHYPAIHEHVAFIPDVNCLDGRLTVAETIEYVSALNSSWNTETAEKLLKRSNLPMERKVAGLSKGMKTKLYLLLTLSLDVELLLLDEPTLGLDLVFRKEFFNTILGEFYDENKTIIISTHQVEEVEHILHDIIFIDEGEIILQDAVEKLKQSYSIYSVPSDRESEILKHNPLIINRMLGKINALMESGVQIPDAEIIRPTLAELFMAKVGGYDE